MSRNRAVLTAAVIVLVAAAGWWIFSRGSADRIDLIAQYDQAEKRGAGPYAVVDATLAGETKKAIAFPPNGRIIFRVKVPEDGWLKLYLGVKPEAWTVEGNGVYFYAGVSDTRAFEKLFEQTLNPFKNPSERRWIPVMVDLSAYAGENMEVILNTVASGPGGPPDVRGDMPLWGAPEIVRR